jgi:hypothetical protein
VKSTFPAIAESRTSAHSPAIRKVIVMRCIIAMASWIAPAIVGASSAIAQQPLQHGTPKDTVKKLDAIVIVATPTGRGETRGANAIGNCS